MSIPANAVPAQIAAPLAGKRCLVIGIANNHSIAYGCAKALRAQGAELAITYLNDKALPHVEPLASELEARLFYKLDVQDDEAMAALFADISEKWGRLDCLVHSIAFAPKQDLQGRLVDSSSAGFLQAMDISCHSFIRAAKLAEPLMTQGGALITMTYLGADRAVEHYGLMGPVKAALESSVRYLAAELGPQGIRVHAISAGPIKTRAASGLQDFDQLVEQARLHAPTRQLTDIDDIGPLVAFLASDAAKQITGNTLYVDGGYASVG
jgi:enoyl-[acyl-carrier protein] reductase I